VILIWRGWGLLALVMLFPLLASCAGLIEARPFWLFELAAGLSLLAAGVVCVHYGTRWNRNGAEHSLYFVPLQAWGWVYLALVALLGPFAIAGTFTQGLDKPGMFGQAIVGAGCVVAVACAVLLLVRSMKSAVGPVQGDDLAERPESGDGSGRREP